MSKYYINNAGFIPYLGVSGPVNVPVEIEDLYALKMIKEGYALERVNPFNSAESVLVTVDNFYDITFVTTRYEAYKRELAYLDGKEYVTPVAPMTKDKDNEKDTEEKEETTEKGKDEETVKETKPAPFNKKK